MATVTEESSQTGASTIDWKAGVLGGIAGGLVMGALIFAMNKAVLAVAIPSLYGLAPPPNPVVGLLVHLFHGAVLGGIFAGIVNVPSYDSPGKLTGLGTAWGVVTWIVLAGLLMPLWLSVVGSPASPPFPNFAVPSLLWHAVYGVVLGGVFTMGKGRI